MRGPLLAVGRRVRQRHVVNALAAAGTPTRILDAGCGEGRILEAMARRWPRARILGVDEDVGVLDRARALVAGHPRVEVRCGLVGGPTLGEHFDLIVCVDVMEHIRDDAAAFSWLATHLAPRGTLVLHVPASPQRHVLRSIDRAIAAEVEAGEGPHVREGYEPDRCRALLQAANLEPRSVGFTFHRPALRLAEDLDTVIYERGLRPLKAAALPALLLAAGSERRPAATGPGYGLIVVADAPS
ncbi:MAG: class I SAM-dependent methyltransferase [Solirubrobacteraceae bacterium]